MADTQSQSASPPAVRPLEIFFSDEHGNQTKISLEDGDLIATAIIGPNAGKFVNLTYGKWMT